MRAVIIEAIVEEVVMSATSSTDPHKRGFPAPAEGFVVTHLLIVADQDRSREFYRRVMGAEVLRERDPVARTG